MAESVVGFLIKQLSTLLSQESTLLGGLRPDVQFIKDELGSMKAFLRQAEAKEDDDSQLQEWVKQVREVAYDTEDVLDDFAFRFASGHADGFFGRVGKIYNSIKNLKARHRISLEIKDIKARVVEISARHQRYQLLYGTQERGPSSSHVASADCDIRDQALLIEEAKLVGIDQPKKELISKILDDHSHLKLVSVVGMGGLGKTTLVKKVYDDAAVKKQFQSHAWITVSQNFHLQQFLIAGCKLMEGLPLGLQNLTELKALGLGDMSDEPIHEVQNLDKQSDDYQTIYHIPEVLIGHWINGEWKAEFL
ncbi:unnamed protein product [Coffea canephora]|uniref:DH200=94 genomic scaffold, scaffold_5380 n=1 Tax=Coffea canephora TaxID=49390 RepID=A0A068VLZ2_COFCA|nr:unnamed protein product [Coffea canephora]